MALVFSHYEVLGVNVNASNDEIKAAYNEKLNKTKDRATIDRLKNSYYVLSNEKRRYKYDKTIGLYIEQEIKGTKGMAIKLSRLFLTLFDAICTFYWSFLIVVIAYGVGYMIYKKIEPMTFIDAHIEEIIILSGFALMDLTIHFYIRRANRKLKNYRKEGKIGNGQ